MAMGVLNLAGFVGLKWTRHGVVAATIALIVAGYFVLWYYWLGRNWARILVIVTSVLAVLDLAFIRHPYPSLNNSLLAVEALVGLFLLYWLNSKGVRVWFKRSMSGHPGSAPE